MKKFFYLFILTFTVTINVFGQYDNKAVQARLYFDSINAEVSSNKDLQQKVINQIKSILQTLKDDNTATIDTKSLQQLVDSAKSRNYVRELNITRIKEVDIDLKYKENVLSYTKLFNNFYDTELKELIGLLENKQIDRFNTCASLLRPKLILIFEKDKELANFKKAFKLKYPNNLEGNMKTFADYEYVKLSTFKYKEANLKEEDKILLLSYSGLKECFGDTTYYMQFIGIVKKTGDTVRILSPCQYYDIEKADRNATFTKRGIPKDISNDKSFIIFNKNQTSLENKNLKTSIGSLGFEFKLN